MSTPSFMLEMLANDNVRYLVVGGVAGVMHGSSILPQAVDVLYDRKEDNVARLVHSLGSLDPKLRGAPTGYRFVWDEDTVNAGFNFQLNTAAGDLNLVGGLTGVGEYSQLAHRSLIVGLGLQEIRFAALEDLIRSMRAEGKPSEFEAIAQLEALREERGDI